jgi:hypothetical protein
MEHTKLNLKVVYTREIVGLNYVRENPVQLIITSRYAISLIANLNACNRTSSEIIRGDSPTPQINTVEITPRQHIDGDGGLPTSD